MTEIHRSDYFHVVIEHGGQLVRATRSSTAYGSIQAFIDEVDVISGKLDIVGRTGRSLLADLRGGPGRNDDAFEEAIKKVVPNFQRGFRRVVILVRTVAGALQVKRNPVTQESGMVVMSDEAAALEWLLAGRS